ncbi:MAG: hypothetical protein IPL00_14165 [Gammaproteobacteria bacterium]|nr:hypothetical protein [Gammaproteobacteria bacterium]
MRIRIVANRKAPLRHYHPFTRRDPVTLDAFLQKTDQRRERHRLARQVADIGLHHAERMHVRIVQPGHHHAALEIDHPRIRALVGKSIRVTAHELDAVTAQRHRLGDMTRAIHRVDITIVVDRVGHRQLRLRFRTSANDKPEGQQQGSAKITHHVLPLS